jgi:hypothetical protein
MYTTLYQYLVHYKSLSVPGIGTISLLRNPAVTDFPAKLVNPPSYTFTLESPAQPSSSGFFYWLSNALGISDREAVIRFNDFSFDLRRQILDGAKIEWDGVGTLEKSLAGDIRFNPFPNTGYESAVNAEKVIREKPEHMVRVGESEKTSAEMVEMLSYQESARSTWWAIPLAAGLLAMMFAGWYFSRNGLKISATGNNSKVVPITSDDTYKLLP